MTQWIDISVPLDAATVAWPGDRTFQWTRDSTLDNGAECNLSSFAMSAHLGTHIDSPLHYLPGGDSLDHLAFETVIGPARVLEVRTPEVTAADLEPHSIRAGERILLKTANSDRVWRQEPFRVPYVHLNVEAARHLAHRRPALVGVDYLSVGGPDESGAAVHRVLLQAGVWILESLNLHGVPAGDYELICLPLRISGIEGAPARALLRRT